MEAPLDVVVIGAGAAGLTVLSELAGAGLKVLCLEARSRIGGRMHTVYDPLSPLPIELGAEFIHGRPPETWDIIRKARLTGYDCMERSLQVRNGIVQSRSDAWLMIDAVMNDMKERARAGPDQTFAEFLSSRSYPNEVKHLALSYVQGFNAARADVIGIASLAQDAVAAEAVNGDRSFRIANGYAAVSNHLLADCSDCLRLNSVVRSIEWRNQSVTVHYQSALTGTIGTLQARCAVITIPLGVLQAKADLAGAIRFDPQPRSILDSAQRLEFGQVVRLILRFREPVWERREEFAETGFLLSHELDFPTWWTTLPMRTSIITGWSAGVNADRLLHFDRQQIIQCALDGLAHICTIPVESLQAELEAAYFHDWFHDPYARGAYSYAPVSGLDARRILSEPLDETLYFSGEATETTGHSATVHGAIASGHRTARQILSR